MLIIIFLLLFFQRREIHQRLRSWGGIDPTGHLPSTLPRFPPTLPRYTPTLDYSSRSSTEQSTGSTNTSAQQYKVRPLNPFVPTVAFSQLSSNMCCPRDCVSWHNGGSSGAPLKPLRDDSGLRTLSSLRGLRGAPEGPPLCRETCAVSRTAHVGTVGKNGLNPRYNIALVLTETFWWS